METHYEDRAEDLQRLTWWNGEDKQNIEIEILPQTSEEKLKELKYIMDNGMERKDDN